MPLDAAEVAHLAVGSPDRNEIPVLITTERRAFAGWIDLRLVDGPARCVWHVRDVRNALRWDTSDGVAELAQRGPGPDAKLEMVADAYVITELRVIRPLTEEAVAAWYR